MYGPEQEPVLVLLVGASGPLWLASTPSVPQLLPALWGHELLQRDHPASQSRSPSELSASRDCHHVNGMNYIRVTQNDICKELTGHKAIPSRELVSVTPFPGRRRRQQKSVCVALATQSNGYRHGQGPLEASLLNVVPAISVRGQSQWRD